MKSKKISNWLVGLLQSAIVAAYTLSFAYTVQTAAHYLSDAKLFTNPILGMAFVLTAFVFSALLCGGAMLGYPLVLLFDKKPGHAIGVIVWSVLWLAVFLGIFLVIGVAYVGGN